MPGLSTLRSFAILVAAALATAAPGVADAQQTYPNRPIRIVVPSSAGGTQDTLARLIAPRAFTRSLHADIELFSRVAKAAGLIAK